MIEKIVGVFGYKDVRWYLVKWQGYDESEWEREHLLQRDKCHEGIRSFWTTSDLLPRCGRQKQMYSVLQNICPTTRFEDA